MTYKLPTRSAPFAHATQLFLAWKVILLCVWTCTHTQMHTHTRTDAYTHTHRCIHTDAHTHTWMHAHTHIHSPMQAHTPTDLHTLTPASTHPPRGSPSVTHRDVLILTVVPVVPVQTGQDPGALVRGCGLRVCPVPTLVAQHPRITLARFVQVWVQSEVRNEPSKY